MTIISSSYRWAGPAEKPEKAGNKTYVSGEVAANKIKGVKCEYHNNGEMWLTLENGIVIKYRDLSNIPDSWAQKNVGVVYGKNGKVIGYVETKIENKKLLVNYKEVEKYKNYYAARESIEKGKNYRLSDYFSDNDNIVKNITAKELKHATTEEKTHLLKNLLEGWTTDNDKNAMITILNSAENGEELEKIIKGAGGWDKVRKELGNKEVEVYACIAKNLDDKEFAKYVSTLNFRALGTLGQSVAKNASNSGRVNYIEAMAETDDKEKIKSTSTVLASLKDSPDHFNDAVQTLEIEKLKIITEEAMGFSKAYNPPEDEDTCSPTEMMNIIEGANKSDDIDVKAKIFISCAIHTPDMATFKSKGPTSEDVSNSLKTLLQSGGTKIINRLIHHDPAASGFTAYAQTQLQYGKGQYENIIEFLTLCEREGMPYELGYLMKATNIAFDNCYTEDKEKWNDIEFFSSLFLAACGLKPAQAVGAGIGQSMAENKTEEWLEGRYANQEKNFTDLTDMHLKEKEKTLSRDSYEAYEKEFDNGEGDVERANR